MEFLKIVAFCTLAAVVYGVVHDMVTANLSVEYFTVYHPLIIRTGSPFVLALEWGVIATWWMGAFLGLLVGAAAQIGPLPRLYWRRLVGPVGKLLIAMALCALCAGVVGYIGGGEMSQYLAPSPRKPLLTSAVWCAHNASYFVGFAGGLTLAAWVLWKRFYLRIEDGGETADPFPRR